MPYYGICTACGKPCQVIHIDYGIGAYEYWGTPGNDINIQTVSDCCEAQAVDINNIEITTQDLRQSEEVFILDANLAI